MSYTANKYDPSPPVHPRCVPSSGIQSWERTFLVRELCLCVCANVRLCASVRVWSVRHEFLYEDGF